MELFKLKNSLPLAAAKSEIAIFISKIMKYASVQKNEADRKQMFYSHELHWTTKFYKNVLFTFSTLQVISVTKNICRAWNSANDEGSSGLNNDFLESWIRTMS